MSRRGQARLRRIRRALFEVQGGLCYYCGRRMSRRRPRPGERNPDEMATIDHLIPRFAGGTNDKDNLVVACRACNQIKSQIEARLFAGPDSGSRTT